MIESNQLKEKINGNKLLICFEDTDTILASINIEREVEFNVQFHDSLTKHSFSKIEHIAKYNDIGYFIAVPKNKNDVSIEGDMESEFVRLMKFRPIIKTNDICILSEKYKYDNNNVITSERFNNKFRIINIWHNNCCDLVDTVDGATFKNININDITLFKEYHENLYYIQNGFVGNAMCWWALDSKGYTTDIKRAHKFSKEEAESILKNNLNDKRRNERIWDCNYIDNSLKAHKTIIDLQYLENIEDNEFKLS